MDKERNLLWAAMAPSLVLMVVVGFAVAGSVTIPNTFTPGSVADANQVNQNFQSVKTAVDDNDTRITANQAAIAALPPAPQVWAETDNNVAGISVVGVGQKEINSISITAPTSGVLVISGCVFINSAEVTSKLYTIQPKLDGINVLASDDAAFHEAALNGGVGDMFSLNYTVSTAVTAGPHTVSQTAGPQAGTANFFHNREAFTVEFYPTGTATPMPSPAFGGMALFARPNGDE